MLRRIAFGSIVVSALFTSISARVYYKHSHTRPGAIRGRVLDSTGRSVSGVIVNARSVAPARGGVFATKSDERGVFSFSEVPAGEYKVWATKDENDISFWFFNFAPWTVTVIVRDGLVTRGVTVQLSNTARLLGVAGDATTGVALSDAAIFLCRQEDPRKCASFLADRFRFLIPNIPLRIRVSAPGYEDWYYGSDGTKEHAEVLQLKPNTTKELTISLRRSK